MAIRRLTVYFTNNVLTIDAEEDELVKILQHYTAGKLAGKFSENSIIYGNCFTICMKDVVAMVIGNAGQSPAEQMIATMKKQNGEDEAWRESLKPLDDEEE